MKIFFYFLLLINLAVFLWNVSANREYGINRGLSDIKKGEQIETITLVSELDEIPAKTKQDDARDQKPMISPESMQQVLPVQENVVISTGDKEIKEDIILSSSVQSEGTEPGPGLEPESEFEPKGVLEPAQLREDDGEDPIGPIKVAKTEANLPTANDDKLKLTESCFEIGPFSEKTKMHAFAKSLQSLANHVDFDTRPGETQVDYWLLYPAADTYESSKANFDMLKARGFDDIWLFRKGNLRGAISLGLFRMKERAINVQKKFKAKNIDVELKSRSVQTKRYWLMLRFDKTRQLALDSLKGLMHDHTDIQIIQKESCS